jgi:hypothetical protein
MKNKANRYHFVNLILLVFIVNLMTACYSTRVNSGGVCQTDMISQGEGMWKDVKFTEVSVNQGHFSKKQDDAPICTDRCICRVEHKVSFGQFILSAVTLGFVRKSTLRYACCQ